MMGPTTQHIDRRYSDENAEAVPWADAEARLAAAELAWIVTVRPDGHPHATPMVPVVHDGKVYFHTGNTEVKYANIQANPHVLVLTGDTSWDRGLDVAVDGVATPVTDDALLQRLTELYRRRWDGRWQLGDVDAQVVVFEVTPGKVYGHAKGDPFGQTTYRF
jgi:general stress protein 26